MFSPFADQIPKTIIIPLFTALLICGLTLSANSNSYAQDQHTIAVIPKATLLHFWKIVCRGASAAAKSNHCNIIWRGPRVENKIDAQNHLLDLYIKQKVDAIVIAPSHISKLNKNIERAYKAGIKIVIMDSPALTTAAHSYIATNNYAAGKLGAKLLLEKLKNKGAVLLIGSVPGNGSTDYREAGFIEEINAKSPGTSIITMNLRDGTTGEARIAAEEALANPSGIAGIFAVNEVGSEGVLYNLSKHENSSIPFVGIDYSKNLIEGIRNGKVSALITQTPYAMGYMSVKTAIDLVHGNEVQAEMESPVKVITRENVDMATLLTCLKEITEEDRKECPMCFN